MFFGVRTKKKQKYLVGGFIKILGHLAITVSFGESCIAVWASRNVFITY